MAHIVVYLQRSPRGIHPGSVAALCLARDVGDLRGATVTAICRGDGGAYDELVLAAASACGTDQLFFVGPQGFEATCRRLVPRHVFAPYTSEGKRVLETAGIGPLHPVWITRPTEDTALPPVVGAISGLPRWRDCEGRPEPEYEGDVSQLALDSWVASGPSTPDPTIYFVAPQDLDDITRSELARLGAREVAPDYADRHEKGTLIWLDAGPNGLPEGLAQRSASARVIFLAGPNPTFTESWQLADFVIGGAWTSAVAELNTPHWKATLG